MFAVEATASILIALVASISCAFTAVFAAVDYTQIWLAVVAAVASIANTYMLTRARKERKEIKRDVSDVKRNAGVVKRYDDENDEQ